MSPGEMRMMDAGSAFMKCDLTPNDNTLTNLLRKYQSGWVRHLLPVSG
jgi:hypothetical protein